jgi:hypothetical protein
MLTEYEISANTDEILNTFHSIPSSFPNYKNNSYTTVLRPKDLRLYNEALQLYNEAVKTFHEGNVHQTLKKNWKE